jgi:hypothetical protein
MKTQLKRSISLSSLLRAVVLFLATVWFHGVALADSPPSDRQPELPSPSEIRDYMPINHMMAVEYANGRKFMFRVVKVSPRFECNQVKIDPVSRTITITTQAISNVYEYQLEPLPVMTSEWVAWNE